MFAGRNAEAYCLSPAPVKTLPVACRASLHISTTAPAHRSEGQIATSPVATTLRAAAGSLLPHPVATVLQLKGRLDTFLDTGFRVFACEADTLVWYQFAPHTSVHVRSHLHNAGQVDPEQNASVPYCALVNCPSPCTSAPQQPNQAFLSGEPSVQA